MKKRGLSVAAFKSSTEFFGNFSSHTPLQQLRENSPSWTKERTVYFKQVFDFISEGDICAG
jgi:hypothetical protein